MKRLLGRRSRSEPPEALSHDAASRAVGRVALWGVVVSLALLALTVVIALASRSLALTAAAVDCAVDVVAALVLWLGLKLADRKSSRFPFGLYKIENLLQVTIAILIFIAAYEIGVQAFSPRQDEASIDLWIIAGVVVAIVATWAYGWYAASWGKRVSSPALIADGKHRQTDVLSTSLVLAAVISTYAGLDIDRVAAVVILVFAVYSGWGLLVGGMKVLLDASVDAATTAQIQRLLAAEALVAQVDDLAVRSAGRYLFLEATLRLRTEDLAKAHATSERLEAEVRAAIPAIERVNFHLEPRRREILHVAVPLASADGDMSGEFGEAPYFGFAEVRAADGRVLRQEVIVNPKAGAEKQKGILVAEWLVEHRIDVLVTRHAVNKGPSYVLREAGVETRIAQHPRWSDELDRLRSDAG